MSHSTAKSLRFEVSGETSASPEQVIEIAGNDFSPRRAEIWPNVRATNLVIHEQGPDHADVTEGGTGPARFIWGAFPLRVVAAGGGHLDSDRLERIVARHHLRAARTSQ